MKITKMTWQLFIVCLGITLFSLVTVSICASEIYKKFYYKNLTKESVIKSSLIKSLIVPVLSSSDSKERVDSLSKVIGESIQTRITVINKSGIVLGDTEKDPLDMENHAHRPEFLRALNGENGVEERFSTTLGFPMLYIAVPLIENGKVYGALRLAEPLKDIISHNRLFYMRMAIASGFALVLIGIASLSIARALCKPISEMKTGAERIANGDFDFKLRIPDGEETRGLALALNAMAKSLGDRIKTITSQRNELDAILTGMSEGVLAIDANERIITINPAAAEFLGISVENAEGMWIHDIVRNSALQHFLQETLTSESMIETSFILPSPSGERHIHARGKNLNQSKTNADRAILVLHDITRLKKVEIMRKEFVANVSHELRTPLTSVKGFVETIRHGGYDLPEDVSKFLGIISAKTDRLCSMVDDILSLSAIEREYEQREVHIVPTRIKTVLDDAINTCLAKAELKSIAIKTTCDEMIEVKTNADLLEQALLNLIDNAIKYSPEGKAVLVNAEKKDDRVQISVSDEGIGIPSEHLHRVFERFYRVDKARSRKVGGTGLGLAIVKNICLLINAKVTVESLVGKGSTFRIELSSR